MRVIPLFMLFIFAGLISKSQPLINNHSRNILILKDSFQLDTLVIVKGTVIVSNFMEGIDYRINYLHSAFINLKIPRNTLINISYQPVQYNLKRTYRNKDISIIQPEFNETINPFSFTQEKGGFDPIMRNEGLLTNGSIMRGLSVGNSQNAVVNANLNLQLAGRINNDVDVLAAISDENNPIQPEGNTQELQDFDQVFIQFSKNKNKLIVGDYLMTRPEGSYFLNYYKKSRGLNVQTQFDLKPKQSVQVGARAALARGRFVRNLIAGVEGNQGPYRLKGPNGEVFIIIISGTEVVYLDGEKLQRGEQNDYTIDYNSGELVFMPKRLITQYSRIIVEFQYSDRNFARTLFDVNTRYDFGKASVYFNYYTEQDNKNQPFQQSLSDSNKLLLSQVGDNLEQAKVQSEVKVYPYNAKKILYRKIDSLGYTGIYIHTVDPLSDTIFYEVRFAYTGINKGNYKQGSSSSNGRVFEWVPPIGGIMQGDFEPYIQLIAPNRKQMLSVGTQIRFNPDNTLNIETARSDFNKNLYSEQDKANDAGYALKLESKNSIQLGSKQQMLKSALTYEFTDAHFTYIERYRNVEFNRIWNRQLNNSLESDSGNKEHILNWRLAWENSKTGTLFYQLGYYNKGQSSFLGLSHQLGVNKYNAHNKVQGSFEWIAGKQRGNPMQTAYDNDIKNLQFAYTRKLGITNVGAKIASEQSAFRNHGDSLLSGSYSYRLIGVFVKSNDSTKLSYYSEFNSRLDLLPVVSSFQNHTLANEAKGGIGLLQKNLNKLNIDISYRDFKVLDTAFQNLKPEQTLLSRIEYDYGFWKRFVTANTYFQLGSGNEMRRDFQFVEVPVGQGIYVWKDFNGDGQQQLNEFQPASFADKNLANYIKVYLPTTSLINVNNTQFSQTFNINTYSNKRLIGWRSFLYKFSDQAAVRFERKLLAGHGNPFSNSFNFNIPDSNLISLSSLLRNTVFFNRNNPKYGLDFGSNQQRTKSLLTNGFESKTRVEYSLGARFNLNANWSLSGNYNWGNRLYNSEYFSQNNYHYQYNEIKPKITYQWQQQWRIGVDYMYTQSFNLPELGGDQSKVNEMGAELRYSFVKIGVLTLKYSLYNVAFKGNINSPLAYDMLQGLNTGYNQLWNATVQQRFGQNLQINISYDGRKSGSTAIIHTGKMEARYMF